MTVKPYGPKHAKALLEPTGLKDKWKLKKSGIWPKAHIKRFRALGLGTEYELISWKSGSVFADAPNAPDLTKTPALPFPFDGRDLAAFMLAGYGCLVAEFYGEWASGPDEDQLSQIDPDNNFAKRAVKEAFDAYRDAVGKVGARDLELDRRMRESCDAYNAMREEAMARHDTVAVAYPMPDDGDERRRELGAEYTRRIALVNAELAAQEAEMNHLQKEEKAAEREWRHSMVVALLGPVAGLQTETQDASERNETSGDVAATTPAVVDSASSAPGNGKVWTPEKLAELKAHRKKHGTKKTAEHFQVSGAFIRKLLPGDKPKPKGYSAFTHHIK